ILNTVYGYPRFRDQQAAIIEALTQGRDALVLMPTGGGKSLCYQIPSLLRRGVGIIVSPLIALMQDQVENLHQLSVRAAFLNSALDVDAQRSVEMQIGRASCRERGENTVGAERIERGRGRRGKTA